jgi:hypothetical protein
MSCHSPQLGSTWSAPPCPWFASLGCLSYCRLRYPAALFVPSGFPRCCKVRTATLTHPAHPECHQINSGFGTDSFLLPSRAKVAGPEEEMVLTKCQSFGDKKFQAAIHNAQCMFICLGRCFG